MANDKIDVTDAPKKPATSRPDVNMAQPSSALDNNNAANSAALVKDGVLPDTVIVPSISQAAITKDAQLLNAAVTHNNWGISAPDVQGMETVLNSTNAKDRAAIEDAYKSLYGTRFRDDLSKYVGNNGVDYRTVEAMLNRVDGRTNFGGNLEVAMEAMKSDADKGSRLLRAAVSSLNSDQISQMASDMQKAYSIAPTDLTPANATEQQKRDFALGLELAISGREPKTTAERDALNTYQKAFVDHVIEEAPGLSDANRQVLEIMTKGADHRTAADIVTMANVALQSKDLKMFADAVGTDIPAAVDARKALAADPTFAAKYKSTFIDNASSTQQNIAADLLSEGKISLATIIKGDTNVFMGLLDNPENLDLAASNSTAHERQQFGTGKEIALSGRAPANQDEEAALAYYNKVSQAMDAVGMDSKRRSVVEDELQHGGKTLISNLIGMDKDKAFGVFGGGYSSQDLLSGVENMSQADYNLLHNDPSYVNDVLKGLYSIGTNEDLLPRLTQLLQDKAKAPTFADSQEIKRSVLEVYNDTQYGGATQENLASAIATMSSADAAKYKSDADYRAQVDASVQNSDNDAFKFLTSSVLSQVAQTGEAPRLSTIQQIAKGIMNGDTPLQQLPLVENYLQDPAVRERLGKPMNELSDEDRTTKAMLGEALQTYIGLDQIVQDGRVPMGIKVGMGVPFSDLYSDMAKMPEDQRNEWANGNLRDSEKEILANVVAQGGEERLEDKIRAIVVGGGSYESLQSQLAALQTNDQKQALLRAYEDKYKSNLSNDLMPLVSSADKLQYQNYLAPTSDGNQSYFDHVVQTDGQNNGALDASGLTVERSVDQLKDQLTQYQALRQQLPLDQQAKLDELINTAVAQHQAAPLDEIKKLGKAGVDIAVVVATVASLGGLSELAIGDAALTAGGELAGRELLGTSTTELMGTELVGASSEIPYAAFTDLSEMKLLAAPSIPAAETSAVAESAAVVESNAVADSVLPAAVQATKPVEVLAADTGVSTDVIAAEQSLPATVEAVQPANAVVAESSVPATVEATQPTVTATQPAEIIADSSLPQNVTVADSTVAADDVAATQALKAAVTPVVAAGTIAAVDAPQTTTDSQPTDNVNLAPPTVPNDQIIQLATVRVGEGPFMSAERILAAAGGKRPDIKEVKELTAALKKYFSPERNGNKGMDGLKVKYQFITKENFAEIVASVDDPHVQAQLMQFAMAS